jgi:hypothetical protein
MYDYNFFHIGFEVISYDNNQLCSHLEHLIINFLVAKDIIPSTYISQYVTIGRYVGSSYIPTYLLAYLFK